MGRPRSLKDMIADVRQRANMENSEFVTDDEITEYLNQELAELQSRITLNEAQPHTRTSRDINVTSASTLYPLPADFFEVQEVTAAIAGLTRTLEPFMANERGRLLNTALFPLTTSPMYRIQGSNIEFLPGQSGPYTVTLYYISSSPRLKLPTDTVDGYNGYEMAAIYGAAATCLAKEESDPSFNAAQKDRIYKQIDALVAQRDRSHPERVTDVTGGLDYDLFGWNR